MEEVRQGDVVLSFVRQKIVALGVALTSAYDSQRPEEFAKENDWNEDGYRIDVQYEKIESPLSIPEIAQSLLTLFPGKYSPLTTAGKGSQGYLFSIPPTAARFITERIENADRAVEHGIQKLNQSETVRTALVKCRIGQGLFRDNVLNYWGRSCAVADVRLVEVLRASHIKPWRDSNNEERLDCFNGLLLSPTYDALFDQGLVGFNENGESIHSPLLTNTQAAALGIKLPVRLKRIEVRHLSYLKYHRDVVFEPGAVRRKR
jgi:hypothetical protein